MRRVLTPSAALRSLVSLAVLASIVLLVSGCRPETPPVEQTPPDASTGTGTQVTQVEPDLSYQPPTEAESCTGGQMVGRVKSGDVCPAPLNTLPAAGAWRPANDDLADFRLFPGTPGDPNDPPPDQGRAFCMYRWVPAPSATPAEPVVADLPPDGDLPAAEWLKSDCRNVASLGSADKVETLLWPTMNKVFRLSADGLDVSDGWPGTPTVVAVVDSAVEGSTTDSSGPGRGQHAHGRAIGLVIWDLVCPGADPAAPECFAEIQDELAIDAVMDGKLVKIDRVRGGFFGFQGRLARSIVEAVRNWRKRGDESKLVINLSVGWDGRWNETSAGKSRAAVDAVKVALEYASCAGALVFAAAGNSSGGPKPSGGPMFPAAWEEMAAPSDCPAGSPGSQPGADSVRPLLYAVGGVDAKDRPLRVAREKGSPQLMAPASQAVARDRMAGADGHSAFMTGTSVAAAVASAAAAGVWKMAPQLKAHEVAQRLYESGVPLGGVADFCLASTACGERRRIAVCKTLKETALAQCGPPAATSPPGCARWAARNCLTPAFTAGREVSLSASDRTAVEGLADRSDVGTGLTRAPSPPPVCGSEVWVTGTSATASPCPDAQYGTAMSAPWDVTTLPPVDPCPTCSFSLDGSNLGTLDLAISSRLTQNLENAQLVLDPRSSNSARYDIAALVQTPMTPGSTFRITGLQVTSPFTYAMMSFTATSASGSSRPQSLTSDLIVNR